MVLTKDQINSIAKYIKNINSDIAIRAQNGNLIINTINPNIPIQAGVKCKIDQEENWNQFIVHHDFISILTELAKYNDTINIDFTNNKIIIVTDNNMVEILTLDVNWQAIDFDEIAIETIKNNEPITINPFPVFINRASSVTWIPSGDTQISGVVRIKADGHTITFACTNINQLYYKKMEYECKPFEFILERQLLSYLSQIHWQVNTDLYIGDKYIGIVNNDNENKIHALVLAHLSMQPRNYPPIDLLINLDEKHYPLVGYAIVNKESLISNLYIANIMTNDPRTHIAPVTLKLIDNKLIAYLQTYTGTTQNKIQTYEANGEINILFYADIYTWFSKIHSNKIKLAVHKIAHHDNYAMMLSGNESDEILFTTALKAK